MKLECERCVNTFNFETSFNSTSFNNMFTTNAENHDYNTRNALNFEYPNNKLTFVTNLFATRVLKLGITYQIMLKVVKT